MSQTDTVVIQYKSDDLERICETTIRKTVAHNPAANYHIGSGGSRTRAKLSIKTGIALQLSPSVIVQLAGAVELLHNASLVHDDLQDGDERRRGVESVWKKYGKAHAICAGDLMISAAYSLIVEVITDSKSASLITKMHAAIAATIEGQHRDLDAESSIDEKEYETIAALKSGPLIQLTLSLPLLMAGHQNHIETAEDALAQFAVAYQILDDLDDWQQDAKNAHLNLVNIIAHRSSHNDALVIARSRAQHLLKQCQKTLSVMPSQCAVSIIDAARQMMSKIDKMSVHASEEK